MGEEKPTDTVSVPNVIGLSPEAANKAISNAGLYMKVLGASGSHAAIVASNQSISAGTAVERGTVIEVRFADRSLTD